MSEFQIPKVFHQIWLGDNEMPIAFQVLRDHLLSLHPGWDYELWTDDNLPPLINDKLFYAQTRAFYKADLLRYEVLVAHGGVYIDTDFLMYRNIEPILRNTDHFLAYEGVDWVCNSIMGFAPNHWFLWKLISEAPTRSRALWDRWGVERVGPGLVTACAKECPDLLIFPKPIFYPLTAQDVRQGQFEASPAAYGAHLWNDLVGHEALQVWRMLPAAKKYEDRDWDPSELRQMAENAISNPQRWRGKNAQSMAEVRPGSRLNLPHKSPNLGPSSFTKGDRTTSTIGQDEHRNSAIVSSQLTSQPLIGSVPRIVHQIWLQGTPSDQYLELCAGYERQQDFGWEYRLWDDRSITRLIEDNYSQYAELWRSLTRIGQRADLARYLILHSFGGVYADVDTRLKVELDFFFSDDFEKALLPPNERRPPADEPLGERQPAEIVVTAEPWVPDYLRFHHAAYLRKIGNGILFSRKASRFWTDFIEFAKPARDLSVLCSFGTNTFTEFVYRHLLDCWSASRRSQARSQIPPRIVVIPHKFCGIPTKALTPLLIEHYCDGNWRRDAGENPP